MPTLTVENYVKAIFQACAESGGDVAANGDLARRLNVAPGTVTAMLRTLAESQLAEYQSHRGAKLTEAGRRLALRVLRRHRMMELFLHRVLGMAWDEVHDEAEQLEHAASDRLVDRIDEYLGYPDRDPHGDPIPRADGTWDGEAGAPLAQQAVAARFRVLRILDQAPEFLRYLDESAFAPGTVATLEESAPQGGACVVRTDAGRRVLLAHAHAARILVAPA
jgi:DtxR family transcriptional regulator, Mn-dependent transcriptional regulator